MEVPPTPILLVAQADQAEYLRVILDPFLSSDIQSHLTSNLEGSPINPISPDFKI